MDLAERAALVRAARLEIKQRRRLDDEGQRERNANRWLDRLDSRRPRLTRNSTDADRATIRQRRTAYENDRSRRGGFGVGERLREMQERSPRVAVSGAPGSRIGDAVGRAVGSGRARPFGVAPDSAAHARLARRANVRMPSQTRYNPGVEAAPLQRNWTSRIITPSERVNTIGVRSRRRRVSPGLVPGG